MPEPQPQQQPELPEPPQRNKALPRFIGVFAGLISSFFTGKYLVAKSLLNLVDQRSLSAEVNNANIRVNQKARRLITLPADLHVQGARLDVQRDLQKALQKISSDKGEAKGPLIAEAKKLSTELRRITAKYREKILNAAQIQSPQKKAQEIVRLTENRNDYLKRAIRDIENPEIVRRMGWGLRMSPHKKWIYAASIVTLGAVGYAAYKITDHIINGQKEKSYQQQLEAQRAAQTATPTQPPL